MYQHNPAVLNDVYEINLSYLMLAQKLLGENLAAGAYRLGVGQDTAELLLGLSPAQVVRLAQSSSLVCGFRLNDAALLRSLCQGTLDGILQQAHATILLADPAAELVK
ncbi:flagellar transcriptional regulator FlhD [Castellaniella sp.]|uniref:flagellar transcriptional regulator FlhD n=1 Tax=Castellaniella sp. TaxID=1955812 RepID=UPI003560BDB6